MRVLMDINKILKEDFDFVIEKFQDFNFLRNTKWLITGANGMLGSYLTNFLFYINQKFLDNTINLELIVRGKGLNYNENLKYLFNDKNVGFIIRDLSKDFRIEKKDYNYVIHAASKADPRSYLKDSIGTINLNVRATQKLLALSLKSKNIREFVFFSSGEIYGNPEESYIPTTENYIGKIDHLNERSCYVESKRFGETLVFNFGKHFSIPTNIIRPVHIYGPGVKEKDSRVWADFIYSALNGKDINILGDGQSIRGFCYIRDYLLQLLIILKFGKNNEIYNIGNEKGYSIKELAETVSNCFEKKIKINILNKNLDSHKNSPRLSIPSIAKVRSLYRFESTGLDEGIMRTASWIKLERGIL